MGEVGCNYLSGELARGSRSGLCTVVKRWGVSDCKPHKAGHDAPFRNITPRPRHAKP